MPIIFLAHSLGGLVCEDALLASKNSADPYLRQIISHTRGIIFLGTPHCGSDLTAWASLAATFIDLIKAANKNTLHALSPESEVLARIQKEFHMMMRARKDDGSPEIQIICFFEELPISGIGRLVVPMHSAVLLGYESRSIHADHRAMTRFGSLEDEGYRSLCAVLRRWTKNMDAKNDFLQGIETASPVSTSLPTPLSNLPLPSSHDPDRAACEDGLAPAPLPGHVLHLQPETRTASERPSGQVSQGTNQFGGFNYSQGGKIVQGNYSAGGNISIS